MSNWLVLDANYYTPPGGFGTYGLLYNKATGAYQIKQRSVLGEFSSPGLAILYENDGWYGDALRIPDLFTYASGDIIQSNPISTKTANDLILDARKKVYAAYQTLGGNNAGIKLNSSALPQNQTGIPKITNAVPGANPGVAGAVPLLSNPPGSGNILDVFSPGFSPLSNIASTPNPTDGQTLIYPIDMLINSQDTLHITRVEYQSPTQDIFKPGADVSKLIQQGITRNTVDKKTLRGLVILPIPNNPQDSNNVGWADDNMNALTTAAISEVKQNLSGYTAGAIGAEVANTAFPQVGSLIKNATKASLMGNLLYKGLQGGEESKLALQGALTSMILNTYGIEVPVESILARESGVIPNSNLQLLFNSVTLRSFTFAYMMSPRSELEAKRVNLILRFFKQGMAAKKRTATAGGSSLLLGTPNVFKLEYKSGKNNIKGMNKFKICAMTGFSVNYAPNNRWSSYEEGQPSSVIMTMGFKEIEPIYDSDYQETGSDISFDLPSVGPEDIGY